MSDLKTMMQSGERCFAWEVAYIHDECKFLCEIYAPQQTTAELFLELLKQYDKTKIVQRKADRSVLNFNHSVQFEVDGRIRFWVSEVWTGSSDFETDLLLHITDIIDTGKVTGSRNTTFTTPA